MELWAPGRQPVPGTRSSLLEPSGQFWGPLLCAACTKIPVDAERPRSTALGHSRASPLWPAAVGASPEAATGPRRAWAGETHTHHGAGRQGGSLAVVVAVGELQVEQQSAVRRRVQAVRVHQHLQAQAAAPVKPW